ncbi:MAG: hypothetical protein JXP34_25975 [Planctomycetes bacterium]|nr:hypothetical protein [Planctomycetota bacterium]
MLANVTWPGLVLEQGILSWRVIALGFLLEYAIVRLVFSLSPRRALLVTGVANLASALIGMVLVPVAGLGWEYVRGHFEVEPQATFGPAGWAGSIALAIIVNTAIEIAVLAKGFRLKLGPIRLLAFLGANAASAAMALFALPGR